MRYFSSVFNVIGSGFIRFFFKFIPLSQVWLKIASGVLRTRVSNCVMLINNFDGDWKKRRLLVCFKLSMCDLFSVQRPPALIWRRVAVSARSRWQFAVHCLRFFDVCCCCWFVLRASLFACFGFLFDFKTKSAFKSLVAFYLRLFFLHFSIFLFVCRYFEFCLFLLSIKR